MDITGIGQSTADAQPGIYIQVVKDLQQLQGELIVKLLESAKVPGPSDTSVSRNLGTRIDIHA